jgi:hypothetical protein
MRGKAPGHVALAVAAVFSLFGSLFSIPRDFGLVLLKVSSWFGWKPKFLYELGNGWLSEWCVGPTGMCGVNLGVIALLLAAAIGFRHKSPPMLPGSHRFPLRTVLLFGAVWLFLGYCWSCRWLVEMEGRAINDRGDAACRSGRLEEAMAEWNHVIVTYPDTASWTSATLSVGKLHQQRQCYREAIILFERLYPVASMNVAPRDIG